MRVIFIIEFPCKLRLLLQLNTTRNKQLIIRRKKASVWFLLRLGDEMCMSQKGDLKMCKVLVSKSKLLRRDHNNQVTGSLLVYHVTLFVKKQKTV